MVAYVLPLLLYLLPASLLYMISSSIYMRNSRSSEHRMASLLCAFHMLWFMAEYVRALLPIAYTEWVVVNLMNPVAFISMGIAFQLYAGISGVDLKIPRWALYVACYLPAVIMVALTHWTGFIYTGFYESGMWKKHQLGSGFIIFVCVSWLYMLIPCYLLWTSRRNTDSARRVKQLKLYMAGIVMVMTWILAFSALPRFIPYMETRMPSLIVYGTLFWAVSLWLAMVKHDFLPSFDRRFQLLFHLSPAAILVLDEHGKIVESNDSALKLMGMTKRPHKDWEISQLHTRTQDRALDYQAAFEKRKKLRNQELTIHALDGKQKTMLMDTDFMETDSGWLQLWIIRDITELKQKEEQLVESESKSRLMAEQLEIVARSTNDGIWDWDLVTNHVVWSERAVTMLSETLGDLPQSVDECLRLMHAQDAPIVAEGLKAHFSGSCENFQTEFRLMSLQGEYRWFFLGGAVIRNEQGAPVRMVGSLMDISERKQSEERISHMAFHDSLTGLPNRLYFQAELSKVLGEAAKQGMQVAVMLIDLDRFKLLNDTFGHQEGDRLLRMVAAQLLRPMASGNLVARLGGDEFILAIPHIAGTAEAERISQELIGAMAQPFQVEAQQFFYSASIGISVYPEDGSDADELIKSADIAMYRAKARGRGCYEIYAQGMSASSIQFVSMDSLLRRALERGEFQLYYQPQIELATGRVYGAEALLRWFSPEGEGVSPADMIAHAEESGLIHGIGEWVLTEACRQHQAWERSGKEPITVSVNVSVRQLEKPGFAGLVKQALQDTGMNPLFLCLEITESMAVLDTELLARTLGELTVLGIRISIDDFGVGYSSFGSLSRLPISELKIDRSFIQSMSLDREGAAIVKAMIAMAHHLDISLMAEGVETEAQRRQLEQLDCDGVQGYLISKPLMAEAFAAKFLVDRAIPRTG